MRPLLLLLVPCLAVRALAADPAAAAMLRLGPRLTVLTIDELVVAHGPGRVRRSWEHLRRRAPGLLADPGIYTLALRAFPRDLAAKPGPDALRARDELAARGGGPALRDSRTGRAFVELVYEAKIPERLAAADKADQVKAPAGAPGPTADRSPPAPADPSQDSNPIARARARLAAIPPAPAPHPEP